MVLSVDLYRLNEEQTLLEFCKKWNYRIIKKEELPTPYGGRYKHFAIAFFGNDGEQPLPNVIAEITEDFKKYEIEHPGIWNVPEM